MIRLGRDRPFVVLLPVLLSKIARKLSLTKQTIMVGRSSEDPQGPYKQPIFPSGDGGGQCAFRFWQPESFLIFIMVIRYRMVGSPPIHYHCCAVLMTIGGATVKLWARGDGNPYSLPAFLYCYGLICSCWKEWNLYLWCYIKLRNELTIWYNVFTGCCLPKNNVYDQNWRGAGLGEHPKKLGPPTYFCNRWS